MSALLVGNILLIRLATHTCSGSAPYGHYYYNGSSLQFSRHIYLRSVSPHMRSGVSSPHNSTTMWPPIFRKSAAAKISFSPPADLPPEDAVPTSQKAPILNLPVELLQSIVAFLDRSSAAAFCLSSRGICYAVGRNHLSKYMDAGGDRFLWRCNLELIEQAFPSHWYCCFCDKFHRYEMNGGPKRFEKEINRECVVANSYLHDGSSYILAHHHVRLAVHQSLWGSSHGIPLKDLAYQRDATFKAFGAKSYSKLDVEAKIRSGHLLLHATYTVTAPRDAISWHFLPDLEPLKIPQVVCGHRDSYEGHTGLAEATRQTLNDNKLFSWPAELCYTCATDYRVMARDLESHELGYNRRAVTVQLKFEVWRDLGDGRNPFNTSWRAHGEIGNGLPGLGGDVIRLTGLRPGDIRQSFEGDIELPYSYDPGSREFKANRVSGMGQSVDWDFRWTSDVARAIRTSTKRRRMD
jgi:hypothetical protein